MEKEKIFCITCSDHRVKTINIFNELTQDVFYVRTPGNMFVSNESDIFASTRASIDVALSLGFTKFYTIGHTECKAVSAALTRSYPTKGIEDFVANKYNVSEIDHSHSQEEAEVVNSKFCINEIKKYITQVGKMQDNMVFKSFIFDVHSQELKQNN